MSDTDTDERRGWYVIWRKGGMDAIAKAVMAFLAVYLVVCVVTGWAFGAAATGLTIGSVLVLFAFTSGRFSVKDDE